ncbi:hypothetical protein [Sinomonas susongensis]|uniref:hypothetical protein n=1 Tax=Sinomonas susongensis TaxID=1324851 RepID=UPI001108D7FE|nr:hypothetical protein [Sinomonas susongensis]
MSSPSDPAMSAYREAMSLDVPALTAGLVEILGPKLVAYLGSVKETRAVRQWVSGERGPSRAVVKRLRDAYHIARLLSSTHPPEVVQAWFQGMNPLLDDAPPARLLRDNDSAEIAHRVLNAARAFVSE